MRIFIAIGAQDFKLDFKGPLKKLKVNLDKLDVQHKWVKQENLHISLAFLGEVEESKVSFITDVLDEVASTLDPFVLNLSDIRAFSSEREGRVVWMGVQNSKILRGLQEEISRELKKSGFIIDERSYQPHLTLVRLRNPKNLTDALSPFKRMDFGKLAVNGLTLYESVLGGPFPVYKAVHQVKFKSGEVLPSPEGSKNQLII